MLRAYTAGDFGPVLDFWNRHAPARGYCPLDAAAFQALLRGKWEHCFLYFEDSIAGFACGSAGYLSCLIALSASAAQALLDAMENAGARRADFFDPIRLPWVIPGTPGHQHNNCPGVDVQSPLYGLLLARGWQDTHRECAMYLNLASYAPNGDISGIEWYDPARHFGLEDTVYAQGNPDWNAEMPKAARKINMLVALNGSRVIGCAGPVYPEQSGRGYFAGIMVHPDYQGKGHGRRLFYALCQKEKEAGAAYMSLFTGTDNPARSIYESAGFRPVKQFALMRRD